jgi:signal peptidase I
MLHGPALLPGDHIVVNKLVFGARIFKGYEFIDTTYRPRYWRMKGLRKVNRNDILVFNYPYSKRGKISLDIDKFFVKRCVAIPGDSFFIENGIFKIKGHDKQIGNILDQKNFRRGKIVISIKVYLIVSQNADRFTGQ